MTIRKAQITLIFILLLIAISLYLLYVLIGIYLNSLVALKYATASMDDVEYISLYSKVLIGYVILVLIVMIALLRKYFNRS